MDVAHFFTYLIVLQIKVIVQWHRNNGLCRTNKLIDLKQSFHVVG